MYTSNLNLKIPLKKKNDDGAGEPARSIRREGVTWSSKLTHQAGLVAMANKLAIN